MLQALKPFLFVCSFLGAFALSLKAQRLSKPEKREIADVRFIGDSAIAALELQSIIATRTTNWFGRTLNGINSDWGVPRQYIDETTLAEDTLRLFAYYRDKGYFDAHVSYSVHEPPLSPEIARIKERNILLPPSKQTEYTLEDTVLFRIYEGKQYRVEGFTFEGFERLPMDLQDQVTENIGIKKNSQYSKLALQLETIRARQILAENGYPFLQLAYTSVELDTVRKTVTISLRFKSGPRVKFGAARIVFDTAYSALGYVKEDVIRTQLSMDSGAWYKNSEVIASIRDLGKLNTFQYQNITLDTSQFIHAPDSLRDGLELPVVVTLRMRKSIEYLPGLDLGISAFSQFIFGLEFSYANRNLFSSADNFILHALHDFFPSSQRRENIGADFSIPSFLGWRHIPLITSTNFTYTDQRRIDNNELQYLERTGIVSLGSNLQFLDIFNNPSAILSWAPKLVFQYVDRDYRDKSIGIDTSFIQPQFNLIFSHDLSLSQLNDPLNPSSGTAFGISIQRTLPTQEFPTKLPNADFTKITPLFKTFFNLTNTEGRNILGYRLLFGEIILDHPNEAIHDALIENRYFGGGTNSLRGWPARSLLVSNSTDSGRPFFGGYKTLETNLEWRFSPFSYPAEITAWQQFLSPIQLVLFMDAGNIWDQGIPISIKDFAIALGTGVRYITQFGAIRFDMGLKFYDPYPDGTLNKNRNQYLAIPPGSPGVWLFNRRARFWDISNFEFAFGQAF